MPTIAQIETTVLGRVVDAPPVVQDEVPQAVSDAYKEVQDRYNFKWMKAEVDFVTTADTHILGSMPTDFKEFRDKPYWVADVDGKTYVMHIAKSAKDVRLAHSQDREGQPHWILEGQIDATTGASQLEVWPQSDDASDYSDGQYRVNIPYWKYLVEPASGEDVPLADRLIARFIKDYATFLSFRVDWDEARGSFWEAEAEKTWKRIENREAGKWLSGIDTLVPHLGADDAQLED